MLKILGKVDEIIFRNAMYRFYCDSVFLFYGRLSKIQYGKIKLNLFQDCSKLTGFTLQARYLVKKFYYYYFYMPCSSCCTFCFRSGLMAGLVSHFD